MRSPALHSISSSLLARAGVSGLLSAVPIDGLLADFSRKEPGYSKQIFHAAIQLRHSQFISEKLL